MADRGRGTTRHSGRPARVMLVDDHPIVRQGLASLIAAEPDLEVCAQAPDESSAWQLLARTRPDVVVVDLALKEGSGIELIRRIKAEYPETGILVVSMHDEMYLVERAFRAGAWGYVTKHEASDSVLQALRNLLDGQIYLSPSVSPSLLRRLMSGGASAEPSLLSTLSDREMQVFMMIGSGLEAQEIADRLHLSVKTIESYQAHIKTKLNLKNSRRLVQFAIHWNLTQQGER